MAPAEDDVQVLAEALSTIDGYLGRARRQTKDASTLSLLGVIADHPGIRSAAIAERLKIHPTLAASRVRACEDAGYLRVSYDPEDLRSRLVTLEPAGSDELRRLTQTSLDQLTRVVDDWEPHDVRRLADLLDKLRASMDRVSAAKRRARPRRGARNPGEPDWLAEFLRH